MDTLETFEHRGLTVKIYPDVDPQNPRTEWDNMGTILGDHRRYRIADKDAPTHLMSEATSLADLARRVRLHHKEPIVWLAIRMYEHGSVGIQAVVPGKPLGYPWDCPWDSGWVGIIYAPYSKLRKEYSCKRVTGKTRSQAVTVLEGEVKTKSQYMNGEVYGYKVEDAEGEELDSCWGFYGWDYVMSEARDSADWLAESRANV